MRSFATGAHSLKPNIADGFLVMANDKIAHGDLGIVEIKLSQEPFSRYTEHNKVKLGDCSHLLLDTVVELKKDEGHINDIL